jgi:adenylate cyclase
MATEGFKRKLAAVFSADVAGYSRLMGEDETATLKNLETYKQVMFVLIKQHRGRVVASPGDNVLAEFASVVDAVQCGVAVQKEIQARNAELAVNRRMQFRIGINLGDVIEEGDSIYGDGVNIAARLESLAEPGGICVSKTAFEQIEAKLPLGYEFLGEQTVKNIVKPVGAYKVVMEPRVTVKAQPEAMPKVGLRQKSLLIALFIVLLGAIGAGGLWYFGYFPAQPLVEKASKHKMAFPLPDKPSIAVLPFVNMSEDSKQELFADGMTEEIITALSKCPNLFVIARNSTFTYKGKAVNVKQVSENLGVRYVLEGSIQKSEDRIRINAQLIDALTGHHLWAERYDRSVKDVFAMQDEITLRIITALQVKLTSGEMIRVMARGTKNIDAFTKYLQAVDLWTHLTKEANAQAKKLLEEAIALDPDYPGPYIGLAKASGMDVQLGTAESRDKSLDQALEFAQKAISLDSTNGAAYSILSWVYGMKREYDKAIAESERAVSLDPNSAESIMRLGVVYAVAGRAEEGIPYIEKALRLNPFPSCNYFSNFATIYRESGHYEKAIEEAKKALQCEPNNQLAALTLTIACIRLGREEDARAAAAEVLRINPRFSAERWAKGIPFTESSIERMVEDLRKAGLK